MVDDWFDDMEVCVEGFLAWVAILWLEEGVAYLEPFVEAFLVVLDINYKVQFDVFLRVQHFLMQGK